MVKKKNRNKHVKIIGSAIIVTTEIANLKHYALKPHPNACGLKLDTQT